MANDTQDINEKFIEGMKIRAGKNNLNEQFIDGMRNRMRTSFHKYGQWKDNRPHVDAIKNIYARIEHYLKTGNTEGFIDAANFSMMEASLPLRQDAHFNDDLDYKNLGIDVIENIHITIDHYLATGNTVSLMDAAAWCMVGFDQPAHPDAHFRAEASGESPSIKKF